jgi:hypothetical protein
VCPALVNRRETGRRQKMPEREINRQTADETTNGIGTP